MRAQLIVSHPPAKHTDKTDLQSQTVREASLEVLNIDFGIGLGLALTPQEQPIFRRNALFAVTSQLSANSTVADAPNSRNREPKDECPDLSRSARTRRALDSPSRVSTSDCHPQYLLGLLSQLCLSVDALTDVGQFDSPVSNKLQSLRGVLRVSDIPSCRGCEGSCRTSAFCTRIVGFLLYRPRLVSDMISCHRSDCRQATACSPTHEQLQVSAGCFPLNEDDDTLRST